MIFVLIVIGVTNLLFPCTFFPGFISFYEFHAFDYCEVADVPFLTSLLVESELLECHFIYVVHKLGDVNDIRKVDISKVDS